MEESSNQTKQFDMKLLKNILRYVLPIISVAGLGAFILQSTSFLAIFPEELQGQACIGFSLVVGIIGYFVSKSVIRS